MIGDPEVLQSAALCSTDDGDEKTRPMTPAEVERALRRGKPPTPARPTPVRDGSGAPVKKTR